MPNDTDRAEFLAAMYARDDEDEAGEAPTVPGAQVAPVRPNAILSMPALTSMLRAQQQVIEKQDRLIRRLEMRVRALELQAAGIRRNMNNLDAEMERKIDRREF